MTAPRGAPSRQESAEVLDGEVWSSGPMTVVSVESLAWEYRYRVGLRAVDPLAVSITLELAQPPRVGQRWRVALFDLGGGE